MTQLYKNDEKSSLEILFKNSEINDCINTIIETACQNSIIEDNKISTFVEILYNFRNSIVHGKSDYKFEIKIPKLQLSPKDKFWFKAIEEIALEIIDKFCLEK